jgi:hypothetical protein
LRQINATGKIPLRQNPKSVAYLRPSRSGKRGGRASSRTWDGMWWTRERRRAVAVAGRVEPRERSAGAQDERRLSVRQNRVVPAPVAGVKSAEVFAGPTGRGKTVNSPMTVTRRIRRRGEHGISRKAIAQGRRNAPTVPVCSCACSYAQIARETAGAASTRRSLRPRFLGRNDLHGPGEMRRGKAEVWFVQCERLI